MSLTISLILTFVCPVLLLGIERLQAEKGRPWITPNFLTDACVGLIQLAVVSGLLSGFVLSMQMLIQTELPFLQTGVLDGQPGWLQIIVYLIAIDFGYYVFHRVMHSTKTLWVFHAVHHSARRFNPMTDHRAHPFEVALYLISRAVPPAILGGSPPVIVAYLVIDHVWNNVLHCDIRINLGPLKYILVTPQYHRIHHSRELRHFDKNFAGRFILFDYLFGTIHSDFHEYPEIGMDHYPIVEESRSPVMAGRYAVGHFLYPFQALWAHFVQSKGQETHAHDAIETHTEPLVAIDANGS